MLDTYARVLFWFTLVPSIALALALRRRLGRAFWASLGVLSLIVYVATVPWDNGAAARGYWGFDRARTWGVFLAHLPLEEYLFFGLETVLTSLVLLGLLGRRARAQDES